VINDRSSSRWCPVYRSQSRKEIEMRKVVVNEFLSLDGVAQAPGGEDEDRSGGFAHGGWSMKYMDEPAMTTVLGSITRRAPFCSGAAPTRFSLPTGPTRRRRSR
jgi:hypothetical protein